MLPEYSSGSRHALGILDAADWEEWPSKGGRKHFPNTKRAQGFWTVMRHSMPSHHEQRLKAAVSNTAPESVLEYVKSLGMRCKLSGDRECTRPSNSGPDARLL